MKENFLKDQRKCQSYKSTLQRENGRVRKTGGGAAIFLTGEKNYFGCVFRTTSSPG
jgi:hypothetical protein